MRSDLQNLSAVQHSLRQCGFFEEYLGLTDEQAAEKLLQRLSLVRADDPWYLAHPEYRPDSALLTACEEVVDANLYKRIAAWDATRVWSGDLEADVCAGNSVYAQVVEEYARLSMGTLQPTAIVEAWQSEEGPVTLSFDSHGQHFATELAYYDDWIDGEVFSFLDSAMSSQGFSGAIRAEANTGQDVFLVRATEEEKTHMEQLLGWSLDWRALMKDSDEEADY